jgi:hypothetical protein
VTCSGTGDAVRIVTSFIYDFTSRHYSYFYNARSSLPCWFFILVGPLIAGFLVAALILGLSDLTYVASLIGSFDLLSSQSQSHIATDGQIFITITVLFLWGALSDKRTDLSFVYAAGPCQRSLSRVRVPWYLRPYFTVSDLRLPFSPPPTTRRVGLLYATVGWPRRHLLQGFRFTCFMHL